MATNGQGPVAPLELQIVLRSTRPGRAADLFLPWLVDRAERHGRFAVPPPRQRPVQPSPGPLNRSSDAPAGGGAQAGG